jgi:hypothetical protein
MKLSQLINMLKSSHAIRNINFELKPKVSDISSVSMVRIDVVNNYMSLIHIHQSVKSIPHPIGVLWSRRAEIR